MAVKLEVLQVLMDLQDRKETPFLETLILNMLQQAQEMDQSLNDLSSTLPNSYWRVETS